MRGFHVLELLIVTAVVGLLAAISLPQLANLGRGSKLRREAVEIAAVIERLLVQAQHERRVITLLLAPGYYRAERIAETTSQLLELHTVPPPLALRVKDGARIDLFPHGVVSPQRITIEHGAEQCSVTVALRGRVSVRC